MIYNKQCDDDFKMSKSTLFSLSAKTIGRLKQVKILSQSKKFFTDAQFVDFNFSFAEKRTDEFGTLQEAPEISRRPKNKVNKCIKFLQVPFYICF